MAGSLHRSYLCQTGDLDQGRTLVWGRSLAHPSRRPRFELPTDPGDHLLRPPFEHALTHPDHRPSGSSQLAGHSPISLHVRLNLLPPKLLITLRGAITVFATVPEAPVHEDRDLFATENKVWSARQRLVPPPTNHSMVPEQSKHPAFGAQVAFAPDQGHHLRSLLLGPDVGHCRDSMQNSR